MFNSLKVAIVLLLLLIQRIKMINVMFRLLALTYIRSLLPNQSLNRKMILDVIYADKTINLHIYGPEFLKLLYPDSYKGYII